MGVARSFPVVFSWAPGGIYSTLIKSHENLHSFMLDKLQMKFSNIPNKSHIKAETEIT